MGARNEEKDAQRQREGRRNDDGVESREQTKRMRRSRGMNLF